MKNQILDLIPKIHLYSRPESSQWIRKEAFWNEDGKEGPICIQIGYLEYNDGWWKRASYDHPAEGESIFRVRIESFTAWLDGEEIRFSNKEYRTILEALEKELNT